MSIDPGAYEIQNVMHRNFALQRWTGVETYAESDDASTPLGDELNLSKFWSISRLDNGKYSIRNSKRTTMRRPQTFPPSRRALLQHGIYSNGRSKKQVSRGDM
ncbi:hypothetical protein BD410DRAFT_314513 [Rickenella mellea]|uniref:Uncharacterized protein n=1 Tax=Rickenella mellea TaxID=50990 RepID=A0A4Y7Q1F9_9AGAM|nr:hypothetical protein BD410DRAFT_314513 [Rickenella mellea]